MSSKEVNKELVLTVLAEQIRESLAKEPPQRELLKKAEAPDASDELKAQTRGARGVLIIERTTRLVVRFTAHRLGISQDLDELLADLAEENASG